ncbi:MAG: UvrD-helicase domain-containing protein [Thiotrichales bacterium]
MLETASPPDLSAALDPRASATVFASAGTGKTWLLVSRILRLLLDGAEPGGILAITFTNKAAGEMQARLLARLHEWAVLDDDAELDVRLAEIGCAAEATLRRRARDLYERLLWAPYPPRISTFHAFCQDLLGRFALEAGAPPGFDLLETIEEPRAVALDTLFAEAGADPESTLAQALSTLFDACGGLDGATTALRSFLHHRADWWAYTEDADAPLAAASARLPLQFEVAPARDPAAAFLDDTKLGEFRAHAELLGHPKNNQTLRTRAAQLRAALDGGGSATARFERIAATLLTKDLTLRKDPRPSQTLERNLGVAQATRLVDGHTTLGAEILEVLECQRRQHALAINQAWYVAGARFLDLFQQIKRQRRQLDFADLEWLAYRLLNDDENGQWVQYKLDQRIEHVLIDEFQDTNPTQWRLLQPLLREFAHDPERTRSVLLVGDAKQSIYSFRRANPELQTTAAEWLARQVGSARVTLDHSRRSAPAVIDLVNSVFTDPDAANPIGDFDTHATYRTELWGQIEFLPLARATADSEANTADAGLRDPLTTARAAKPSTYQVEGQQIAARIQALVASGWRIGPPACARPIGYGDIQILLRKRTHVAEYEAALRAAGIPVRGSARGRLLSRLEITDLRALLGVLATPDDNHGLARVLRAPLFDARDEDLARLAIETGHDSWYDSLSRVANADPPDSPLRRAAECLPRWRTLAATLPLHDLLDLIYHEGDVLQRYAAAARPWQRAQTIANLRRLLELALSLDSGRYPSLERFLERLATLAESEDDSPNEPLPDHADAPVEILTIHGAKGLEAPVVFYVGLGSDRDNERPYGAMVAWPAQAPRPEALLLRLQRDRRDGFSQSVHQRWQQLQAREDANLLYVALTRARQMLILSGAESGRGDASASPYAQLRRICEGANGELDFNRPWSSRSGEIPPALPGATPIGQPLARISDPPGGLSLALPTRATASEILPSAAGPTHTEPGAHSGDDPDARLRGRAVHAFLEHYSHPSLSRTATVRRRVAIDLELAPTDPRLEAWQLEAQGVATAFPQWFDPSTSAYNEVPITYRIGERTVHGVIDRLIVTPERLVLIDYKTQRNSDAVTRRQLADRYREQLRLYAEGLRRLWPARPLEAGLLFTRTVEWYPVET